MIDWQKEIKRKLKHAAEAKDPRILDTLRWCCENEDYAYKILGFTDITIKEFDDILINLAVNDQLELSALVFFKKYEMLRAMEKNIKGKH